MFKLVVLSALVALVAAKPSHYAAAPLLVAAPVAVPAAVSHSYRVDVHSKPLIATYAAAPIVAAPIVQKTIVAAPVAYAAPVALSAAVSHQSRVDVHHSAHAVGLAPLALAAPAVHAW